MKILIISDAWHPQVNGVVRTYEHLSHELEKMGHTCRVIGPEDFEWKVGLMGYPEIKLALFPYKRLAAMIVAFQPDMIHLAVEGPLGWAGRRYCIRHKLDFTTSYHTHFPRYLEKRVPDYLSFLRKPVRKLGRHYVRTFHKFSKFMLVATEGLEEDLRQWQFKNPILRLTRGVDTDIFHPGEKTLFKDLKTPIALYVGRIAIEKNLEEFLRMPWEGTKVLVGDGPSKTYLERKYPDALFTGKKSGHELAEHYRSADVFVFPSLTDTFGIVLIEALGCGLPVAGYPVTGPKDIITQDFMGALDNDLGVATARAITRGSREERSEYVKDHFSWGRAAQQFLAAGQSN